MKVKHDEIESIKSVLVPTWQSVVAVSFHAKVGKKRALAILKYFRDSLGLVEMRDCRLDGHNPVWMVRPKKNEEIKHVVKPKTQPCLSLELEI